MVKPGDEVMVGPVAVLVDNSVDHFNGQKPGTNWVSAFMAEHAYPWHPALPAVAKWLSENQNGTERLWHVLDIYGNSRHAEGDAEQTLSSLIEALSHD